MGIPALTALEQNYPYGSFGSLTGGRKVAGAKFTPQEYVGVGVIDTTATNAPSRAIDNAPRLEKLQYNEYLPAQAGRKAGVSTLSIIG